MRVLLVSNAGGAHLRGLLPLGQALRRARHEVAVVTPPEGCRRVAKAGFDVLPGGLDGREARDALERRSPRPAATDVEGRAIAYYVRTHAPAMAESLVRIGREWRPDLLVHEEGEFATPVAASVLDVPYACQSLGPMRPLEVVRRQAEAMLPLWERWERAPGALGGLLRYLYLDVCPPQVQHPDIARVEMAWPVRPAIGADRGSEPEWVDELGPGPNVYVALGTGQMFNRARATFRSIVEALGGKPGDVIVNVGRSNDPAAFRGLPPNFRLERYVPEGAVMAHCDLVVSNASPASLLASLAHGLPLLALPRGSASQERVAEACVRGGVGLRLGPQEVTAEEVARCVRALVVEGRFRQQAAQAERQIATMPSLAEATRLLDRLARDRRPLPRPGPR